MRVYGIKITFIFIGLLGWSYGADHDWWERGSFYQIYPRSFKDSDGDGIGDLKGVIEKVDYLAELGVAGVWLSPIFKSPMVDFGYDCSDYLQIQPEYGTTEDLVELIQKANAVGIQIILDFVPNHTSDLHEWFIKSAQRDPEYENFYVWHPGKYNNETQKYDPPNNWVSVFRFSAWTYNEVRGEYYLHQFAKQQPDLNYREPKVVEAMKNVLRYWLGKGVGGFRIDAVPFLFEILPDADGNYLDEPLSHNCNDPDSYCYLIHNYTQDQDETFDMAYQWRAVLDEFTQQNGGPSKIIMTEAYTSLENIMRFYGEENGRDGSNIPFNFELINYANMESTAGDFRDIIHNWMNALPQGRTSNWVMGNHDNKRLASRFGVERVDILNILLQTLPGIGVTYNGEELGMTDVYISWEETVDPQGCNTNKTVYNQYSRDPARTPFQWDNSTNAGFSSGSKTWLPVSDTYKTVNVAAQKAAPRSHLKVFQSLTNLKKTKVMQDGDFTDAVYQGDIYLYKRELANEEVIVVILNFSKYSYQINVRVFFSNLPSQLEVVTSSIHSGYRTGNIVSATSVRSMANVGTVLRGVW